MNAIKRHIDTYITNYLISNNQKILRFREKYRIPAKGFNWKQFSKERAYPTSWYYVDKKKERDAMNNDFNQQFADCQVPIDIESHVFAYLMFDDLKGILKDEPIKLIKIQDTVTMIEGTTKIYAKYPNISKEVIFSSDLQIAKLNPIAILLTPDITKTSLKKFIDTNWNIIEVIQNKYRDPLKKKLLKLNEKSRGLNSNLRRMYIFQNREKNSKELRDGLYKRFGYRSSEEQIRTEKSQILRLMKKKL